MLLIARVKNIESRLSPLFFLRNLMKLSYHLNFFQYVDKLIQCIQAFIAAFRLC